MSLPYGVRTFVEDEVQDAQAGRETAHAVPEHLIIRLVQAQVLQHRIRMLGVDPVAEIVFLARCSK